MIHAYGEDMLNYGVHRTKAHSLFHGTFDEAHRPHGPNQVLVREGNTIKSDGNMVELPIPI